MNLMVDGVKEGLQLRQKPLMNRSRKKCAGRNRQREKPAVKEKSRTKKGNPEADYESIFFQKVGNQCPWWENGLYPTRVSRKLTRIIQVIGEDKISIYAYLDNLLDYHFQEFGEQITKSL